MQQRVNTTSFAMDNTSIVPLIIACNCKTIKWWSVVSVDEVTNAWTGVLSDCI